MPPDAAHRLLGLMGLIAAALLAGACTGDPSAGVGVLELARAQAPAPVGVPAPIPAQEREPLVAGSDRVVLRSACDARLVDLDDGGRWRLLPRDTDPALLAPQQAWLKSAPHWGLDWRIRGRPVRRPADATGSDGRQDGEWSLMPHGDGTLVLFPRAHPEVRLAIAAADAGLRLEAPAVDCRQRFVFEAVVGRGVGAGPIVITRGGRYSGTWISDHPDVAAVTIATTEPVVLEDAVIVSRGAGIAHDRRLPRGVDLEVRRVRIHGLNPLRAGRAPGRALELDSPRRLVVELSEIYGTGGLYVRGFDRSQPGGTIRIHGNRALDIDGRIADGRGGFVTGSGLGVAFVARQFVQLNQIVGLPGVVIGWNDVRNRPWLSRVEDVVNLYLTSGARDSPILVHDNFVDGAWPGDPSDRTYAGGGLMLGDQGGGDVGLAGGDVLATDNVVLNSANHGIAIAAGSRIVARRNRVLADGRDPASGRARGSASAVGFYVWDYRPGQSPFADNRLEDNYAQVVRVPASGVGVEAAPYWLPDCRPGLCVRNAERLDAPRPEAFAQERERWLQRARAQGVPIGAGR